jgi:hypothetical protein
MCLDLLSKYRTVLIQLPVKYQEQTTIFDMTESYHAIFEVSNLDEPKIESELEVVTKSEYFFFLSLLFSLLPLPLSSVYSSSLYFGYMTPSSPLPPPS